LEVVLLDHQTGPGELEQLLLCDDAITVFNQGKQHIERSRTEADRLVIDKHAALRRPDGHVTKAQFVRVGHVHRWSS
jgi:hypothetical protein